jgi:hypothetical protein
MCLAVYLASDRELPDIRWNEESPAFYLEGVPESEPVRKRFLYSHVYYAGSHEGCGCGFSKEGEVGEELERCQQNYIALSRVASDALANGARLQLFACWEGEQTCQPESVAAVDTAILQSPSFELQQLQLLDVHASAA